MFQDKIEALLGMRQQAYGAFHAAVPFHGPSLYFHHRALCAREALAGGSDEDFAHFAEMVYAVLTSWGMHGTGASRARMVDFQPFRDSLRAVAPRIEPLMGRSPQEMTPADWCLLKEIFLSIEVMASSLSLVGNSKVLAHCLPRIVAPIDRQYTLTFLDIAHPQGNLRGNLKEREAEIFITIERQFFHSLVTRDQFVEFADEVLADDRRQPWDTSRMKLADNLVIGVPHLPT